MKSVLNQIEKYQGKTILVNAKIFKDVVDLTGAIVRNYNGKNRWTYYSKKYNLIIKYGPESLNLGSKTMICVR